MVNKTQNIRQQILELLYLEKQGPVSGVMLSEILGISRVAVWKHIAALKERHVEIESGPKGYRLANPDDLLMPFCFKKEYQDKIYHFQQIETTMDQAHSLAKGNAPHLSVVIAEHQSSGRGRLNRQWFSSKGGLWFTLILKPQTPPPLSYIYNFAASLSLSKTINELFDLNVSVKWPNDLLLNGKKLAGLLSEMETRGDMVEFINIGIGVNVNNSPEKDEPRAISLKTAMNKPVSRKQILERFLDRFQQQTRKIDCPDIIRKWKEQTSTIGSQVRIETVDDINEGCAIDIDDSGALIIEDHLGRTKRIIYGDCFHT